MSDGPDLATAVQEPSAPTDAGLRRAVTAAGLPGTCHSLSLDDVDEEQWQPLSDWTRYENLTGVLLAAAESGAVQLSGTRRQRIAELHLRAMMRVLVLERVMLRVVATLDAAGIPTRVLKGSAYARLDYANPSQRSFSDVDLLVRPEQLQEALARLEEVGYHRVHEGLGSSFDHRFGKGAMLRADDGTEVDLHRTLVMGRFGLTVDLDDLWAPGEAFTVGGQTVVALSPEARMLHAAYHAVVGNSPRRALPYRDLAEMALYGRIDKDGLLTMARRWSAEAVLATAVQEAWDWLGLRDATALSAWAGRYQVSAQDRRVLELHRGQASYAAQQLAAAQVLPWRERAAFLAHLAFPDRAFLRANGTTRARHLWRAATRGLSS